MLHVTRCLPVFLPVPGIQILSSCESGLLLFLLPAPHRDNRLLKELYKTFSDKLAPYLFKLYEHAHTVYWVIYPLN